MLKLMNHQDVRLDKLPKVTHSHAAKVGDWNPGRDPMLGVGSCLLMPSSSHYRILTSLLVSCSLKMGQSNHQTEAPFVAPFGGTEWRLKLIIFIFNYIVVM